MSELGSVAQPAASRTADLLDAINCNTAVASSHSVTTPASRTVSTFSFSSGQPSTPLSTASTSVTASPSPALLSSSSSPSASAPVSTPSTPVLSSSINPHTPSPASVSPAASTPTSSSCSSSSPAAPLRSCLLRLGADLKALESDPPEGIDASPVDPSNLLLWRACLFGPADSEWEGAVLSLSLSFLASYPLTPPAVRFTSRIFHPNVFPDGSVCLDIIAERWSPAYTVSTVLTSIQSLLCDPNPASPANPEAARLWAKDKKEYRRRVRACVAAIVSATH